MPKLAETLRRIGQNGTADIFYRGPIGQDLVDELRDLGGIMTMDDLKSYNVVWEDPVEGVLSDGKRLFSSPPPGSGSIVGGILTLMDSFFSNRTLDNDNTVTNMQRFTEACKFAFAQRSKLGDWNMKEIQEQVKEVIEYIFSKKWIDWVHERFSDTSTKNDTCHYGANYQYELQDDHGTSHISVLAANGDAVAVTSTINTYFGSGKTKTLFLKMILNLLLFAGIMSESTGIVLNNEMDDFSTPNVTNVYGIAPSEVNFIRPGKRPTSSMSPTIVTDAEDNVRLVIGASGGPRIISAIAFVAMKHLWMDQDIKSAIDAPRIHHQLLPMEAQVEVGMEQEVVDGLKTFGHKVKDNLDVYFAKNYGGARVQGIAVDENGIITANNDRRKEGEVDGF